MRRWQQPKAEAALLRLCGLGRPGRAAPQALEDEPAGNAGHPAALAPAADLLALDVRSEDAAPHKRGGLEPVTMQVTTPPGDGRRSATYSDTDIHLACGNPTQSDRIRRNRQVW